MSEIEPSRGLLARGLDADASTLVGSEEQRQSHAVSLPQSQAIRNLQSLAPARPLPTTRQPSTQQDVPAELQLRLISAKSEFQVPRRSGLLATTGGADLGALTKTVLSTYQPANLLAPIPAGLPPALVTRLGGSNVVGLLNPTLRAQLQKTPINFATEQFLLRNLPQPGSNPGQQARYANAVLALALAWQSNTPIATQQISQQTLSAVLPQLASQTAQMSSALQPTAVTLPPEQPQIQLGRYQQVAQQRQAELQQHRAAAQSDVQRVYNEVVERDPKLAERWLAAENEFVTAQQRYGAFAAARAFYLQNPTVNDALPSTEGRSYTRREVAQQMSQLQAQLNALETELATLRRAVNTLLPYGVAPLAIRPVPPWSAQALTERIAIEAEALGLSERHTRVITEYLVYAYEPLEVHARVLGYAEHSVARLTNEAADVIRANGRPLQYSKENKLVMIAQALNIRPSELIAGFVDRDDKELGRRVINAIPGSHRDGVAELLLNAQTKSYADVVSRLTFLDLLFHGGDPFVGDRATTIPARYQIHPGVAANLSRILLGRSSNSNNDDRSHTEIRLELLRTLGFSYEDILRMNPLGAELAKNFDPRIGTYSEEIYRVHPELPRSREVAAQRLLESKITYRSMGALVFLQRQPWLMPQDLLAIYDRAAPDRIATGAYTDLSKNFRAAQQYVGRDLPRGISNDLMNRAYRQAINLLMLQSFGLGVLRAGDGQLQPIPPGYHINWPTPIDTADTRNQAPLDPERPRNQEVTWEQLWQLLQAQRRGAQSR